MTRRLTVRLPDHLHERLSHASQERNQSLNDLIIEVLRASRLEPARPEGMTPQQQLNWALRGLGGPLNEAEIDALDWDEDGLAEMSDEELDALLAGITP